MPARNDVPAAEPDGVAAPAPPLMVAVGSPEFNQIVKQAVVSAISSHPPAPPREIAVQSPAIIPQTSIDTTKPGLDDLTVRFHRFCTFQGCGYQRNSEAGFPRAAAEALAAAGTATIVHDPRRVRAAA